MSFERINPPDLAVARGFSHAVATDRAVTVHLAGQTGMDQSGKIIDGGVVEQFQQAFGNLLRALEAAGGRPSDLVSVVIYIVDMDDYLAHAREIGSVWRALAGTDYPAMAGVGVARLWDKEALVEVQGVAALNRATPQE